MKDHMKSPEIAALELSIDVLTGERTLDSFRREIYALGARTTIHQRFDDLSRIELLLAEESSSHWDIDEFKRELREITETTSIVVATDQALSMRITSDAVVPADIILLTPAGI